MREPLKTTFNLYHTERRNLWVRISYLVQRKLTQLKWSGIKHIEISRTLGVPKTRISEAYHRKYVNEDLVRRMISHGYLSSSDFFDGKRKWTEHQAEALQILLSETGPGSARRAS